jgi:hypothetical protein
MVRFEWYDETLKRMKVAHRPSTVKNYDKQLKKWVSPRWGDLELRKITRTQVHKLVLKGAV